MVLFFYFLLYGHDLTAETKAPSETFPEGSLSLSSLHPKKYVSGKAI